MTTNYSLADMLTYCIQTLRNCIQTLRTPCILFQSRGNPSTRLWTALLCHRIDLSALVTRCQCSLLSFTVCYLNCSLLYCLWPLSYAFADIWRLFSNCDCRCTCISLLASRRLKVTDLTCSSLLALEPDCKSSNPV